VVPLGEKMLYSGTEPESYITEHTLVYENKPPALSGAVLAIHRVGTRLHVCSGYHWVVESLASFTQRATQRVRQTAAYEDIGFISHNVLIEWFLSSQLPYTPVDLIL